jgi:protoporphyrinogen/coproporphyrinogen III oxidase
MKAIVVGAGAAGLAALHELSGKGIEAVAFEQREQAGGRTISFEKDGYRIDLGAQFMSKDYEMTSGFLNAIGLGGDLVKAPVRIRLWNNGSLYPMGMSPDPRAMYGNLRYFIKGYSPKGWFNLARIMAYIARRWREFSDLDSIALDLDRLSLGEFALTKSSREVLQGFLQPVITGLILEEPEVIGATLGIVCMRMTVIGFMSGLLTPRRGFGSIPERMHEIYGDGIKVSTPVERIVIEGGSVKGVEVGGDFVDADAVICATTATAALRLLPGLPPSLAGPLAKARYSACCHVVFAVDNHPFPAGEFARYLPRSSGSPIAFIGSGRAKSPEMAPAGGDLVHCFVYGKHAAELNRMGDEEIAGIIGGEAAKYLPTLPESPVFSKVCRFDEAVFLSPPGSLAQLIDVVEECPRQVKGLYLAGEYTNVGGVETAVKSGLDAARMAFQDFG